MKKKFSNKTLKTMERRAAKCEWLKLVDIKRVSDFAAWLSDDSHEWLIQSPDVGEILRAWKHGRTIHIYYDGKRTKCGRYEMALYLTFECFNSKEEFT